jgi:hypothetical protein
MFISKFEKCKKQLAWVISFFKALPYNFTISHIFHPFLKNEITSHTMIHSKYPLELATLKVDANYTGKQENSLWKTNVHCNIIFIIFG